MRSTEYSRVASILLFFSLFFTSLFNVFCWSLFQSSYISVTTSTLFDIQQLSWRSIVLCSLFGVLLYIYPLIFQIQIQFHICNTKIVFILSISVYQHKMRMQQQLNFVWFWIDCSGTLNKKKKEKRIYFMCLSFNVPNVLCASFVCMFHIIKRRKKNHYQVKARGFFG